MEARTLHCSSMQCLLQPKDFVASKGNLSLPTQAAFLMLERSSWLKNVVPLKKHRSKLVDRRTRLIQVDDANYKLYDVVYL